MKIEKLPSGSYRMRKMYKGKTYTVNMDYKPTQKEAIQMMADIMKMGNGSRYEICIPARYDGERGTGKKRSVGKIKKFHFC